MSRSSSDTTHLLGSQDSFIEYKEGLLAKAKDRRYWIPCLVVLGILALAAILAITLSVTLNDDDDDGGNDGPPTGQLVWSTLSTANIFTHLNTLQDKAAQHNNSRSVRDGYNASAEYVASQLQPLHDAGYCTVSYQYFYVPVYQELSKPTLRLLGQNIMDGNNNTFTLQPFSYQYGVDFAGIRYGGNGTYSANATLHYVAGGCNLTDFQGVSGKVVLVQEGGCDLPVKAFNAEKAGAMGIFLFNQEGRTALLTTRLRAVGWLQGDPVLQIPALTLSYSVGSTLKSYGDVQVEFYISTIVTMDYTYNIFCTLNEGKSTDVVMIGSHLDSVPEGPGLNDNASGSSSILEILLNMYRKRFMPLNKIRFAWWGAEEIGLLGSYYYVHILQTNQTEEYKNLACYLNFDMLASPNYIPMIFSGSSAPPDVRNQSTVIQSIFEDFFGQELKKPFGSTPMGGGSDYYPFVLNGIPSGGMAAGAGELKTIAQRETFGGLANAQLDTCYHKACDTVANLNPVALNDMSKAAAYTLVELSVQPNLRAFLNNPTSSQQHNIRNNVEYILPFTDN